MGTSDCRSPGTAVRDFDLVRTKLRQDKQRWPGAGLEDCLIRSCSNISSGCIESRDAGLDPETTALDGNTERAIVIREMREAHIAGTSASFDATCCMRCDHESVLLSA